MYLSDFALGVLVHGVFQCFTSTEFGLLGSGDFDHRAGAGIAAFGRFAVYGGEGTETDEAYFFAFGHGFGNDRAECIDAFSSLRFGQK